jgi:hypothetical protein
LADGVPPAVLVHNIGRVMPTGVRRPMLLKIMWKVAQGRVRVSAKACFLALYPSDC